MVWDTGLEPIMGNPPVSKTGAYTNLANPTNKMVAPMRFELMTP